MTLLVYMFGKTQVMLQKYTICMQQLSSSIGQSVYVYHRVEQSVQKVLMLAGSQVL